MIIAISSLTLAFAPRPATERRRAHSRRIPMHAPSCEERSVLTVGLIQRESLLALLEGRVCALTGPLLDEGMARGLADRIENGEMGFRGYEVEPDFLYSGDPLFDHDASSRDDYHAHAELAS